MTVPITKVLTHYRVSIPEYARHGDRVKLCCPFHQETQPSFTIYLNDNSAYCFGCSKPYDSVAIIQHFEECRFTEALHKLAFIGGFVIPNDALPEVRRAIQRNVEKLKVGKGDEYYRQVKLQLGIAFARWLDTVPKREKFWHLIDYFWDEFEDIEVVGSKELDKVKDLLIWGKKFFMSESLRWLFFFPRIPRELWAMRVDEDLGTKKCGNW
jgi:hypothetical protein